LSATEWDAAAWHDDTIYGLSLRCPDPDRGVWTSDLIFDIDHIVEWLCTPDGSATFRVAAATLAFHDAGSLKMDFDFGTGWGDGLSALSIAEIARQPDPAGNAGRPGLKRHRFTIRLTVPPGGEISLLASGHTLTRRGPAHLLDQQTLPANLRPAPT